MGFLDTIIHDTIEVIHVVGRGEGHGEFTGGMWGPGE